MKNAESQTEERHLTKNELYQYYSGVDDFTYPSRKWMQDHLDSCKECAETYRKITKELLEMKIGLSDDPIRSYR
jgi:hypothetical protein